MPRPSSATAPPGSRGRRRAGAAGGRGSGARFRRSPRRRAAAVRKPLTSAGPAAPRAQRLDQPLGLGPAYTAGMHDGGCRAPRASAAIAVLSSSGAVGDPVAVDRERLGRPVQREVGGARVDPATGWRRNSSAVTMPKLPPPPRSAQNRSGWRSARRDPLARGRDHLGAHHAVGREAMLAGEPADPAAERESGHANGGRGAGQRSQPERRGGRQDLAPGAPGPTRATRRRDRPAPSAMPRRSAAGRRRRSDAGRARSPARRPAGRASRAAITAACTSSSGSSAPRRWPGAG